MIELLPQAQGSTRDRLLAAGVRLFAERGFDATTIGDIEAAAGLKPRRGAAYHYFPSKQALLEAAAEAYVEGVERGLGQLDDLPGLSVEQEAMLAARWFLAELDAEEYLVRILEREGARLGEVRDRVRRRIIDGGHRRVEELLRRRLATLVEGLDTEAMAVLLIGALANPRRVKWTYGAPPLDVDDDRLIATWAKTIRLLDEALEGERRQRTRARGRSQDSTSVGTRT